MAYPETKSSKITGMNPKANFRKFIAISLRGIIHSANAGLFTAAELYNSTSKLWCTVFPKLGSHQPANAG
jgi:hypothetical protein